MASVLRLSILLFYCSIGFAQDAPLSLEDCVRKALAAPSTVGLARKDRDIADADIRAARAGFLPQAGATVGYTYNSPSPADRSTVSFAALNGFREFVAIGTIFQEIDTSGRLRAEYAIAKANRQAAVASLAVAERDLKRAVAGAYYRLLLARHLAGVIGAAIDESASFEKRTRLLNENGEAARADVVKASAQVAQLRQSLTAANLAGDLANQDLASYWTADVTQPLQIVDVFEQQPPAPQTPAGNYLKRPEFNLFEAQRLAFKAEARRERSALLPKLTFEFQYGIDSLQFSSRDRGYALLGALNVPIFDWFRAISRARQFESRAAQVVENREITTRSFSREYESASLRVKRSLEQLEQSRTQVTLAEEDLKLSRIRYEGGEGPALEVVVSQNSLAQARANYYSTLSGYWNARTDLEVAAAQ